MAPDCFWTPPDPKMDHKKTIRIAIREFPRDSRAANAMLLCRLLNLCFVWIHDGVLDSRWICGFTMDFWIQDGFLDSRWIPRFTMDSWIHDGLLDSRWITGVTMDSWIHDGFFGFTMDSQIHDGFLDAPHV